MDETWGAFLREAVPEPWLNSMTDRPWFRIELDGEEIEWEMTDVATDGDLRRETHVGADGALVIEAEVRRVSSHGAVVVGAAIENASESPSGPITRLELLHLAWQAGDEAVYVRNAGGGPNEWFYPPRAFRIDTLRSLKSGWLGIRTGHDGRSSNENLPLLAVGDGDRGVVAGMEWSGLWYLDFLGGEGSSTTLRGGVPVDRLVLEPGESLELPQAHYVFSEGGLAGAQNAFRRYVHECITPPLDGEPCTPPAVYNHWFGIGADIGEGLMLELVDAAREIGVEYFVLDAGWYGGCSEGNFQSGVGNWEIVDEEKFPDGLEPLAEAVKRAGLKFGLWFEPERAHRDSHWAREHPDWFWDIGGDYLHINLAVEEAQRAILRVIGDAIERLDLGWVKWDYNINPRPFWEQVDPTGKAMLRYMEGLYRVQDALVERHSDVIFECCASGGRRIDLGTLRRAHTALLSDHVWSAAVCRAMETGASHFLPGSVNGCGIPAEKDKALTPYDVAARMAGVPVFYGWINRWSPDDRQLARRMIETYKGFRHLLVEDFYALTPRPRDEHEPDAVQFCARDGREAVLMAWSFQSPARKLHIRPRGLVPQIRYTVDQIVPEGGETRTQNGRRLMERGLTLNLEPASAVFLHLSAL